MKTCYRKNLLLILLVVLLTNFGCQKKREIAPFFDDLYFKYKDIVSSGSSSERIYRIKELHDGYEVIEEDLSPILPRTEKHIVDLWGFIKESTRIRKTAQKTKRHYKHKGKRICIWIPAEELQVSNKFETSLGNCQVEEKRSWKNWDVWVLKGYSGVEFYYDIKTGFFVGSNAPSLPLVGSMNRILIDTNADIPH